MDWRGSVVSQPGSRLPRPRRCVVPGDISYDRQSLPSQRYGTNHQTDRYRKWGMGDQSLCRARWLAHSSVGFDSPPSRRARGCASEYHMGANWIRRRAIHVRIAHVVTYLSGDGAFGGPASVAVAQTRELARRGHDVSLIAASPTAEVGIGNEHGVRVERYRAHRLPRRAGFVGMVSLPLLRRLRRAGDDFDIVHVHLGRDFVSSLAVATLRQASVPYVVQPHGMIAPRNSLLVRGIDTVLTRPNLRDSAAVLSLTDMEDAEVAAIESSARLERVVNAVEVPPLARRATVPRRVVFLARLHPRKRPLAFVEMAGLVARDFPDVEFVVAGPDEGEGASVDAAISEMAGINLSRTGAIATQDVHEFLRAADVYVLPSYGEVFPMTVLEAFQVGTPVVATSSLGIAAECSEAGAARITDGTPSALAREVSELLLSPDAAGRQARRAHTFLSARMNVENLGATLVATYAKARETCDA